MYQTVPRCFYGVVLITILLWFQIIFPKAIFAHRPELTEAKFYLFPTGQYRIEIISDIFNFIKKEFDLEALHQGSTEKFDQLTGSEIETLLASAQIRFLKELKIQNDQGAPILIKKTAFLNVGRLRKAVKIFAEENRHVITVVTLKGNIPSSTATLQIKLPEDLGNSFLQIIRNDHQMLQAAEQSKMIWLKPDDKQSESILADTWKYLRQSVESFFLQEKK